jgi:hypothetical protein
MWDELRAALWQCRRLSGALACVKEADGRYRLMLYRANGTKQAQYVLTWDEFRVAFRYWERISRPGRGRARERFAA